MNVPFINMKVRRTLRPRHNNMRTSLAWRICKAYNLCAGL